MTKQKLNDLLDNLENASESDLEMLESLSKAYPYAQSLTILQAKVADKINHGNQKKYLSKAAIYAVDRNNLKLFIQENQPLPSKKALEKRKVEEAITQNTSDRPVIPDVPPAETVKAASSTEEQGSADKEEETESSQLFKEVMDNLNVLKSLRKKYEFLEQEEEENKSKKNPEQSSDKKKSKAESANKQSSEQPATPTSEEESSSTTDTPVNTSEQDPQKPDTENKPQAPSHSADDDTQNSNNPSTDADENPNKLIQSYLENEPNYSARRAVPDKEEEEKQDLSMQSATISDDLVSENLALLMVSQGKTDKAIDIYKKLIWKFPQKKTYFASRIEELTNQ